MASTRTAVYPAAMFSLRRLTWILGIAVMVAAIGAAVWTVAYRAALDQLAAKAESDLTLAADRLTSQLFRTRQLAVVLADHPTLQALLGGGSDIETADAVLREVADKTGTETLELLDRTGRVVAASHPHDATAARNPTSPLIARALNGALGTANRIEPATGRPAKRFFSFAAPVFTTPGPARGALLAEVDVYRFDQNWPTSPAAVFFTNAAGRIIVSNRAELTMLKRSLPDFLGHSRQSRAGHDIWTLSAGPYLPARALHLSRALPVIGVTAEILADTAPARQIATLQAAVAGAFALVFGAFGLFAAERRRALADANARLEARVAERTRELVTANRDLTREIGERREAEEALKQAQADLVQAGKLSALGQMSAGLSHELNQPLMAIRSFADNAGKYLDRGKLDQARGNLGHISDLARRMGRIIQNLRAFVRNEKEPVARVDLVQVIDSAVELTGARLKAEAVTLDWQPPAEPVAVLGGEVRLTQVFVNLINNAADAMAGQPQDRRVTITIEPGARPQVVIRDTGPGIADPDRIFEPFYTTKAVGSGSAAGGEDGMGLGLSISYGLVQSFGGDIRGTNAPGRGAIFSVVLEPWKNREQAA